MEWKWGAPHFHFLPYFTSNNPHQRMLVITQVGSWCPEDSVPNQTAFLNIARSTSTCDTCASIPYLSDLACASKLLTSVKFCLSHWRLLLPHHQFTLTPIYLDITVQKYWYLKPSTLDLSGPGSEKQYPWYWHGHFFRIETIIKRKSWGSSCSVANYRYLLNC